MNRLIKIEECKLYGNNYSLVNDTNVLSIIYDDYLTNGMHVGDGVLDKISAEDIDPLEVFIQMDGYPDHLSVLIAIETCLDMNIDSINKQLTTHKYVKYEDGYFIFEEIG